MSIPCKATKKLSFLLGGLDMRNIEVKRELSFDDLDEFLWSGAKQRWDDATNDQKERVWERIVDYFIDDIPSVPSETEVNDLVWFECDDIFNEEDEEEDDEVEDVDESNRYRRNHLRVIESKRRHMYKR